jgi:hypothetical protein
VPDELDPVSQRLQEESVRLRLKGGAWWLTASSAQRLRRLALLQLLFAVPLGILFVLLSRADAGAAVFATVATEAIILSHALAMYLAPERFLRWTGRISAPGNGPENPLRGMPF